VKVYAVGKKRNHENEEDEEMGSEEEDGIDSENGSENEDGMIFAIYFNFVLHVLQNMVL
jgi:hypothetical protein